MGGDFQNGVGVLMEVFGVDTPQQVKEWSSLRVPLGINSTQSSPYAAPWVLRPCSSYGSACLGSPHTTTLQSGQYHDFSL